MSFFTKEVTHKKFTIRFKLAVLFILLLSFWIFHSFILEGAGNFLVAQPYPSKNVDVILLEEDYNNKQAINFCNTLFKETYAKEIWVVVLPDSMQLFTKEQLEKTFKESLDTMAYNFPFKFFMYRTEHPYTLNKSNAVLDSLRSKGYKKVMLLTEGFHSKRSFKVYKKIFAPQGIDVYCTTYFTEANPENWWTFSDGFRRVVSEYLKYFYYLVKGYI